MNAIWNPEFETLAPDALAALESERLVEQIAYNYASSGFYRDKLDSAGIRPESITSREALAEMPFTEKSELAASQLDGSLIGVNQCAALEDIVRIQATGGTTGQPMRIAMTRRDIDDFCEMGARALWANGCRPRDVVFECMNYNLYVGGLSDHLTFERLGAVTIPFGVGNSHRLLEMMRQIRGDVAIWSTPSYTVRLAEVAAELDVNPKDVGLRKGFFSGEAGLQVAGYRDAIEDTWGLRCADLYGTGELGMHCGECEQRQGFHYGAVGYVLTELINPDSGDPLVFEDGAIGEFVYTSIRREASPLMRMRSRDLMQVFTEPCACGRTTFRFRVLGRSDDMFIVRGVNVFPQGIQATLVKLRPRLTGEFQVVLDHPPPIDYPPRVRAEVGREVPQDAWTDLAGDIREAIAREHNFSCEVELVPQGSIATETETQRLLRAYREETNNE